MTALKSLITKKYGREEARRGLSVEDFADEVLRIAKHTEMRGQTQTLIMHIYNGLDEEFKLSIPHPELVEQELPEFLRQLRVRQAAWQNIAASRDSRPVSNPKPSRFQNTLPNRSANRSPYMGTTYAMKQDYYQTPQGQPIQSTSFVQYQPRLPPQSQQPLMLPAPPAQGSNQPQQRPQGYTQNTRPSHYGNYGNPGNYQPRQENRGPPQYSTQPNNTQLTIPPRRATAYHGAGSEQDTNSGITTPTSEQASA